MKTWQKVLIAILAIVVAFVVFCSVTPVGRTMWNSWFHEVQKADDATKYQTRKQVEDTCRSMIASYNADRLTYEQYKDSDNPEKQSWAEQAKMRANKTASSYNEFILKNSYVWSGNVPNDILSELEYIN